MKKIVALFLAVMMAVSATACASNAPAASSEAASSAAESKAESAAATDFKIGMVTDTGGVNDQSFNQSAWEGLQKLSKDTGVTVK